MSPVHGGGWASVCCESEGRVTGPWAEELGRVWLEKSSLLIQGKLSLDISNMSYADADGIRVLRDIYSQARPEVVANTPWTRHLAAQIAANHHDRSVQEQENADNE
jgi:hypothetical protein